MDNRILAQAYALLCEAAKDRSLTDTETKIKEMIHSRILIKGMQRQLEVEKARLNKLLKEGK